MNDLTTQLTPAQELQQKRGQALTGILENTIASLDLSPEQQQQAEITYNECGKHLALSLGGAEDRGTVFPQGSVRLGTAIPPFRDITEIFDLDLVFHLFIQPSAVRPETLCLAVGEHLRAKYTKRVKPLPKGWCIDFGAEHRFKLDVIPAAYSVRGGNIISVTSGTEWKDSNPRDYAAWFDANKALSPRFHGEEVRGFERTLLNSVRVEPLPLQTPFKAPLQRIVQISKRYRDYFFNKKTKQQELLTPSIVLTTLLTHAYARLAQARSYFSGFELLQACVDDMPNHLQRSANTAGQIVYALPNPSLPSENLVEKWKDPKYSAAFFAWHAEYAEFLRALDAGLVGGGRRLLTETFGERGVTAAFAKHTETLSRLQQSKLLTYSPTLGVGLALPGRVPPTVHHGLWH